MRQLFKPKETTMPRLLIPILFIGTAFVLCVCLESSRCEDLSKTASLEPPYKPAEPFQKFLNDLKVTGNPLNSMTARSVPRFWLSREIAAYDLKKMAVSAIRDITISARNHQIALRVYDPMTELDRQVGKRLPILVFIHGGGWTLGSIGTYDALTRALANKVHAVVVSVDYRLAPEQPFPAAVDDVNLAVAWIARHPEQIGGDPRRIAVAGDSGGATLATVAAMNARKKKLPVIFQVLFYPSTNISSMDTKSYREYGDGYSLTKKAIETFRSFYLPDREDWKNPEASPLLTKDADLKFMPTTLIVTAGCDPLRDEGRHYADRLKSAGISVKYRLEEDMIHGFLGFLGSPVYPDASKLAEQRLDTAVTVIRDGLGTVAEHK
jgi:acetyl esterase